MFFVAYLTIWTLYVSLGMQKNTTVMHFNEGWMVEMTGFRYLLLNKPDNLWQLADPAKVLSGSVLGIQAVEIISVWF